MEEVKLLKEQYDIRNASRQMLREKEAQLMQIKERQTHQKQVLEQCIKFKILKKEAKIDLFEEQRKLQLLEEQINQLKFEIG